MYREQIDRYSIFNITYTGLTYESAKFVSHSSIMLDQFLKDRTTQHIYIESTYYILQNKNFYQSTVLVMVQDFTKLNKISIFFESHMLLADLVIRYYKLCLYILYNTYNISFGFLLAEKLYFKIQLGKIFVLFSIFVI